MPKLLPQKRHYQNEIIKIAPSKNKLFLYLVLIYYLSESSEVNSKSPFIYPSLFHYFFSLYLLSLKNTCG